MCVALCWGSKAVRERTCPLFTQGLAPPPQWFASGAASTARRGCCSDAAYATSAAYCMHCFYPSTPARARTLGIHLIVQVERSEQVAEEDAGRRATLQSRTKQHVRPAPVLLQPWCQASCAVAYSMRSFTIYCMHLPMPGGAMLNIAHPAASRLDCTWPLDACSGSADLALEVYTDSASSRLGLMSH